MEKYNFELDLNANDTTSHIVNNILPGSDILEFGAAYGRLTKFLKEEKKCRVDIVEIDEKSGKNAAVYSVRSCIGLEEGNIENYKWVNRFQGAKYDFIILADVMEHLLNPQKVLLTCKKFLKQDGKIIISVPNIAHNAIIYNLLEGDFPYKSIGLLDNTHVHFFTPKTLLKMCNESGYQVIKQEAVYHTMRDTEFEINVDKLSPDMRRLLYENAEGSIYQIIYCLKENEIEQEYKKGETEDAPNMDQYRVVCYIMEENDDTYTEQKSIRYPIKRDGKSVIFDLSHYHNIKNIRIDPIDTSALIKINSIELITDNEKKRTDYNIINGYLLNEGNILFSHMDPQIEIKAESFNEIKKISVEIEYFCYDFGRNDLVQKNINYFIQKLQEKEKVIEEKKYIIQDKDRVINERENIVREKNRVIEEKENIITNQNTELNGLYNSFSWKITRPLRFMKRCVVRKK